MIWYLITLSILIGLALIERTAGRPNNVAFIFATILVVLFTGTRYETGFDWAEYEKFFLFVSPLGTDSSITVPPPLEMEFGFKAFIAASKTLGLPFQFIMFVISAFNIVIIAWFAKRYCSRPVLVLVWYFGMALLPAQMAALRQGMSFSIILLALHCWQQKRTGGAVIFALIAPAFHVFALAIAPLVFLKFKQPRTIYVLILAIVGIGISVISVDVLDVITTSVVSITGSGNLIADKLSIYNSGGGTIASITGLSLVVIDLLFLYFVQRRRDEITDTHGARVVNFAVSCALFSVFAHTFLGNFPAVWNRISYISFFIEMVVLIRWYESAIRSAIKKQVLALGASIISLVVMVYGLSGPSSLPYKPYQSILAVWVTGDRGDGRLRYDYAMREAEREIENSRR